MPPRTPATPGRRAARAALVALVVTGGVTAVLPVGPASAAGNTLVVDVSSAVRPVTHVGSGGLDALADDANPDAVQLPPLRLNQLTQPPPGVQQLGNGATVPTGDALKVAAKAIGAGAQMTVRMPDVYPDFPYRWVSWSDWLGKVDTMVKARLAATGTTNINGWELWNEPDGTWDTAKAGPYLDGWNRTYREVRALDTRTPIVGPSYSRWDVDWMRSFLQNAKANNTVPDVICWHELSGYGLVTGDVQAYRALERELGIGPLPISINEYATPDEVDVPSAALHYVAQFERTGVRDAERAYWFESGTVEGLLYQNRPTSTYWLYQWLGQMAGTMVAVTPAGYVDGAAAYDFTRKVANVVFGGDSGTNTVQVDGLASFGSSARVTLNYTPSLGRMRNLAAPTTVSTTTYPVTNGRISVPVTNMDYLGAYQLVVTPAAGPVTARQQTYEAENATVSNAQRLSSRSASNAGYVGRIDNSGDARTDSFVDFLVDVPTAATYQLRIRYANGGTATATQGLAANGSAWSTVSYPPTGAWGSFGSSVTASLPLRAGSNVIRLAKGSPYFAGGSGYAELDSITLTP